MLRLVRLMSCLHVPCYRSGPASNRAALAAAGRAFSDGDGTVAVPATQVTTTAAPRRVTWRMGGCSTLTRGGPRFPVAAGPCCQAHVSLITHVVASVYPILDKKNRVY